MLPFLQHPRSNTDFVLTRKMADNENHHKKQQPEWLDSFLQKTFFEPCSAHPIRRNELNKYCINCDSSACQYCISSGSHRQHKILKIYRHVYKDVVSLSSIEKYMDCSRIQPYKSNKRLVIALNPLPHSGPTTSNGKTSCEICKRRLSEPDLYDYCSISCEVMAFSRKTKDQEPPHLAVQAPTEEKQSQAAQPSKARHRRKGKPQRAPFF